MAGHIRKLSSGKWQARFPKGGGKYRSRNFNRKGDAERWLRSQADARDRGEWVDPRKGKTPFGEVASEWMEMREGLAESTKARDRSYLDSLILPTFGDSSVGHITTEDIEVWMRGLDKAPATVHKAFQILSGVMARAVTTKRITVNPSNNVEGLPRVAVREIRVLNTSSVVSLAKACASYESLIWAAATTGLRWAELAGLRWENISGRTITVIETVVEVEGKLITKPPKTAKSRRKVTIPEGLVNRLPEGVDYVWTDSAGGPLRRSNFMKRVWEPACDEVGIEARFHDLRHTHVAWLIESGVHPKVISERVGHASITVTMDRYGHLMEGLDAEAADAIDDLLAS